MASSTSTSSCSRHWLDCLADGPEEVATSVPLETATILNDSTTDHEEEAMADISKFSALSFVPAALSIADEATPLFSSDSDDSEDDMDLPNLSAGSMSPRLQSQSPRVTDTELDELIRVEHQYAQNQPESSGDAPEVPAELEPPPLLEKANIESSATPVLATVSVPLPVESSTPDSSGYSPNNQAAFVCPHENCLKGFNSFDLMKTHIKYEHAGSFKPGGKVSILKVVSPTEVAIDSPSHQADVESTKTGMAYNCSHPHCNASFSAYQDMIEHLKGHDVGEVHTCTIRNCEKTFRTLADLREHMYSHRENRIFSCRICEQAFQFSYQLREHMHSHEDEEEGAGERTGRAGGSMGSDGAETRTQQPDSTNEYMCTVGDCGETFTSKYLLTRHMITHETLLPHKCSICGTGFEFGFLLTRHMKTHGFKCAERNCSQNFQSTKELIAHMKTHEVKKSRGRPKKVHAVSVNVGNTNERKEAVEDVQRKSEKEDGIDKSTVTCDSSAVVDKPKVIQVDSSQPKKRGRPPKGKESGEQKPPVKKPGKAKNKVDLADKTIPKKKKVPTATLR